jgi:hypothetical protein
VLLDEPDCYSLSVCQPKWLEQVLHSYDQDECAKGIIAKLAVDNTDVPNFSLQNGLLRYKNRIWVGSDDALQLQLLAACHNSAVRGHSGISVTYRRMKQFIAWKGLKSAIQKSVDNCLTCKQSKPDRSRYPGLLQPLPVPDSAWQIITMDFVEGLPLSGSANCILVVIDKLVKYAHFLPLRHPFTAQSVAKLFLDSVYKLHGLPQSIVPDRDKIFTSLFWRELFRLAHVQFEIEFSISSTIGWPIRTSKSVHGDLFKVLC